MLVLRFRQRTHNICFFFFQAEDGIRDLTVTGVQTCALPISRLQGHRRTMTHLLGIRHHGPGSARAVAAALPEIAPDLVLVEGPPEGDAVLELAADPGMRPP